MSTWTFQVIINTTDGQSLSAINAYELFEGIPGCSTVIENEGRRMIITVFPRSIVDAEIAKSSWARAISLLAYLLFYSTGDVIFGEIGVV